MKDKIFVHQFPELTEAIDNGYSHDFTLTPEGLFCCLSNPTRHYEIGEIIIQTLRCSIPATLYLLTTKDGLYSGTFVEYWEHFIFDF